MSEQLPVVVVVGAGLVGLSAAVRLIERGLDPLVLEAGPSAGTSVREWGHVRLFSAWSELVDPAAARLLKATGWEHPDSARYPTGAEWADGYLRPLAEALGNRVRFGVRVPGVARAGRDRVVDSGREDQPFTVRTLATGGAEAKLTAGAVIDASGTWTTPNLLGADGLPDTGVCGGAGLFGDPDAAQASSGGSCTAPGSGRTRRQARLLNRLGVPFRAAGADMSVADDWAAR